MKVLLLGFGRVGETVADMLKGAGDYTTIAADCDHRRLSVAHDQGIPAIELDATDAEALEKIVRGVDVVLSAAPHYVGPAIARVAAAAGKHYFDLSEDAGTTREVIAAMDGAGAACVPQCGVSPGFVAIVAQELARRLGAPLDIKVRVGFLPLYPSNRLKYNVTWNVDGLFSEYTAPCEAVRGGQLVELVPLEGKETFSLDGKDYEAFNTAGGLGSMCESFVGKARDVTFKTIRYPGHLEMIRFLMDDLGMRRRRDLFKTVLENGIPVTEQDVVLIYVTVTGQRNGRLTEENYVKKIYNADVMNRKKSAIQTASAAAVCTMVDLLREGKLPAKGYIRQEDVALGDFLANRFGAAFA